MEITAQDLASMINSEKLLQESAEKAYQEGNKAVALDYYRGLLMISPNNRTAQQKVKELEQ